MIRVVLFLLAVAVLAAGVVWIADRPGDVAVTWMGYRIETSVMVAALAIAAVIVVVMLIWTIVRGILRSPEQVSLFFRHRRAVKGYLAITRGLIAVGAGDLRIARKAAADAARLSPGDPLALLLTAQSAQMAGDRSGAERAFSATIPSCSAYAGSMSKRSGAMMRRARGSSPRKRRRHRRRRHGPAKRCSTIVAPPPTGPAHSLRSIA
jgi:HemY protein